MGKSIRKIRVHAGLSQEGLSAKIQIAGWDLSRAGLSKIEAGLRRVNDAELWVLAEVLGCSVNELFPDSPKNLGAVLRHGRD